MAMAAREPFLDGLWRTLAFCGRYGHQPIGELKRLTIRDLTRFADALTEILQQEKDSMSESVASGGG